MLHITRWHRVSNKMLYKSTRTQSIANSVENRALAYAGKVARMHAGRVQQQLLFGWMPTCRPQATPRKTIATHYRNVILERARKLKDAKDRNAFYSRRTRANSTKLLTPKPWDDARLWVQAAQDERLWQRLINIANHRHVKTSKGWIDIAHVKTSGKGQATAPLTHKPTPINEADKAEMAAHPDVFQYGQWMHWVPGYGAYTAHGNEN